MWPDQVSNPGPLTYESGALLTALHSPARASLKTITCSYLQTEKIAKGNFFLCSINSEI